MIVGEEPTYSTLTQETMNHRLQPHSESIALNQIHSTSNENLIHSDSVDGAATRVASRSRVEPEAYQIPVSSRENLTSVGRTDSVSVGRFPAGTNSSKRHVSSTSSYDSTSHLLNRMQNPRPSNSSTDHEDNINDYEDISGDDGSFCDSPTPSAKAHGRSSVGSTHVYHQLAQTRKHSDAATAVPPATFFLIGKSSPQLRGTVSGSAAISNGFASLHTTSGSQMMPNGGDSRPQHESLASSAHVMKQQLMAQFQSADDMATHPRVTGPESSNDVCSELPSPPPYTSRPSSDAILHMGSAGRDSPLVDNAAYGGISHNESHAWYLYESDVSLNSSTPQTPPANASTKRPEQIEPYAMIHNEHIVPHPRKMNGTNFNNNSSVRLGGSNSTSQQTSSESTQAQPLSYAESGKLSQITEV